ncbi:MAG: SRPBCC family protein [Polyangiales bacterium]
MTSISTSASVLIPRPREQVFLFATDSANAPETIHPRGPFAGITKIEMHEGQSLAKGSRRRVVMTDGTVLEEVILDYDPPVRHRYGWTGGAKLPFSLLVRSGTRNWDFTEAEGGTRIAWTYTFGLTSPLAYPLAIPIIWLFKGWLQQGLDAIRAELVLSDDDHRALEDRSI